MTLLQAIVLAVTQGLTEFLPISSSGHLVLISQLSSWYDQGVVFDAAVHLGTLMAILVYLRKDVMAIAGSMLTFKNDANSRLGIALLISTIPVLAIGYALAEWIDLNTRTIEIIIVTTIVFGLLLGIADLFGRQSKTLQAIKWPHAVIIGLAQVIALIPGTSRSGITMTAALALGFKRVDAARFSFLLAIPVLAAAGGYSVLKLFSGVAEVDVSLNLLMIAMLVSAVIAFVTIELFIRLVEKIGMWPFVVYRLLLGGALIALVVL